MRFLVLAFILLTWGSKASAQIPRFEAESSGLVLERSAHVGAFFDVLGERSGVLGHEGEGFEVWTWPVRLLNEFELAFRVENYPLDIAGASILAHTEVRPEATVFTYSHPLFTVKQTLFAPVDEMGIIMLLDVDAVRPLDVIGTFRADLALMWPAGLMTGGISWNAAEQIYRISESAGKMTGAVLIPGASDESVMPHQEAPQDVPTRFVIPIDPVEAQSHLYPLVMAGSATGFEEARNTAVRMLASAADLYQATARHYRDFLARTISVDTPDPRLDEAYAWAKIGIEKGRVTNPHLGTGFVAGYGAAGAAERPGYAWFFGRDGMWTALALMSYGDHAGARTAMDFLARFQREDGMIPHELSQSAGVIDWFGDYGYAWHSADATPLFVIAHAEHFRQTGDLEYLRESWDAIVKAHRFTASTDAEGNHLVDNYGVGHGWVEERVFQIQEELYMQGLWVEANRGLRAMAFALGDATLARSAREAGERTRSAMEDTYWMPAEGRYRWSTAHPGEPAEAESYWTASTALTAVPMWWNTLDEDRAQAELNALGGGALSTDWGARLFSEEARHYDPISYHFGSVWPLFSGWVSMAGYRYARPTIGYQALMATALLTRPGALGYVTELLSGDFNASFGRSSPHQMWSEAMVVAPLIRGTLGLEIADQGRLLRFAPQPPADWGSIRVRQVMVGDAQLSIEYARLDEMVRIVVQRDEGSGGPSQLEIEPALPLDAGVLGVTLDGEPIDFQISRRGDRQFVLIEIPFDGSAEIRITRNRGSDAYAHYAEPAVGARNQGLRILSSRASSDSLEVVVEGLPGRPYLFAIRTPARVSGPAGITVSQRRGSDALVELRLEGEGRRYVRKMLRFGLEGR